MATVRTAKKLMLGREIAHMIETAGLSQAQAAEILETSQGRIAGLIKGEGRITPGDLTLLAVKLGFTDEKYHEFLLDLRRDSHKRGFWSSGYRRIYPEDFRLLVDLENHADYIRGVEVEIIPGIAQCESYIRAIYSNNSALKPGELDDYVQARLARRAIFTREPPPKIHFILSESCLRREWGSPEVMREQLQYLIELGQHSNIKLQILPFSSSGNRQAVISNKFTLLRISSPGAAGPLGVAYVENPGEIRYLDEQKILKDYETIWADLSDGALNTEETQNFIKEVIKDFHS